MDYTPESEQIENQADQFDTASLDARINDAADAPVQADQDIAERSSDQRLEQRVQQLQAETEAREANELAQLKTEPPVSTTQPEVNPEPPPEHQPKMAIGEKGNAERAENGPEKPEKEVFTGYGNPERGG